MDMKKLKRYLIFILFLLLAWSAEARMLGFYGGTPSHPPSGFCSDGGLFCTDFETN